MAKRKQMWERFFYYKLSFPIIISCCQLLYCCTVAIRVDEMCSRAPGYTCLYLEKSVHAGSCWCTCGRGRSARLILTQRLQRLVFFFLLLTLLFMLPCTSVFSWRKLKAESTQQSTPIVRWLWLDWHELIKCGTIDSSGSHSLSVKRHIEINGFEMLWLRRCNS